MPERHEPPDHADASPGAGHAAGNAGSNAGSDGGALGELARLFLKLGVIAFGGPAAHIAMLEDEVVARRRWLSRQHFLDLVGATNLIPGPNSTEMALHVGYERAGWRGLLVAGACFIGPAVAVTGALAWLYVQYGQVPAVQPWLYGIKPAVLAVILAAVWKLGKSAVKDWRVALTGVAVAALVLGGTGEIAALLVGGAAGGLWRRFTAPERSDTAARFLPILFLQNAQPDSTQTPSSGPVFRPAPGSGKAAAAGAAAAGGVSLWKLGLFFLKVGSVLYGSGYVLVAFLEGGLVEGYGWLTRPELLDAVAIGQFTPGPVLSTATFVGAVVAGVGGALVATLGIFLPSFAFVAALNPLVPRLRESVWLAAILDAVNVSAVALMAAVTLELGAEVLAGGLQAWPAWIIAGLAAAGALVFRLNAAWLVLGGAALGGVFRFVGVGL